MIGFRLGAPRFVAAATMGQPDVATVRALLRLPDGGVAAGTDYGVALWDGAWRPFPFPAGARAQRVDALGLRGRTLCVATTDAWFEWPIDGGAAKGRRLPSDGVDGHDDVRSMLGVGDRLYVGWRCRFEGGDGPADAFSLALGPDGAVYAGSRDGEVRVVGGPTLARFGAPRGRPVRHLAFAHGALWAAADGALHRWDGAWTARRGEPTFLHGADRLWAVIDGRVAATGADGWPAPLSLAIDRPWCLLRTDDALWVGVPGGLWIVPVVTA